MEKENKSNEGPSKWNCIICKKEYLSRHNNIEVAETPYCICYNDLWEDNYHSLYPDLHSFLGNICNDCIKSLDLREK